MSDITTKLPYHIGTALYSHWHEASADQIANKQIYIIVMNWL